MNLSKWEKSLIISVLIFGLCSGLFLIEKNNIERKEREKEAEELRQLEYAQELLEDLRLEARAVSVYNISKDLFVYGRNENEVLPLASLAKIMTALVSLDNASEDIISITEESIRELGDSSLYLHEKWNKADLLKFMLIFSSNDAARAVAGDSANFVAQMNSKAKRLGLTNMTFYNITGLDQSSDLAGAYGTANEVNLLSAFALKSYQEVFFASALSDANFTTPSGFTHKVINTNTSISRIPNLVFSKTGATNLAGGNLTVIFENERGEKIAVTVLGSTLTGRFTDVEQIVNVLYNINYEK